MDMSVLLRVVRPKHWIKNTIIALGMIVAWNYNRDVAIDWVMVAAVTLGMLMVSSLNYLINDLFDRDFDLRHKKKKERDIAKDNFDPHGVISLLMMASVLVVCLFWSPAMAMVVLLFVSGLIYNIPPVRAKDIPFVDVMVESLNNPIRFAAGWLIISPTMPPLTFLALTWVYSNVLMTGKRLAEQRYLGMAEAEEYRVVFKTYTLSNMFAAMMAYTILTMALIASVGRQSLLSVWVAMLFGLQLTVFTSMCLNDPDTLQSTEEIYKKPLFALYSAAITAIALALLLT